MEPLKEVDDTKPRFFCPDCNHVFANMGAMKTHMKTHRETQTEIVDLPEFPKDDLEVLENPAAPLSSVIKKAEDRHRYNEFLKGMLNDYGIAPVSTLTVKVKKLPHGLDLPELKRGTSGAAAVDLYAAVDKVFWLGAQSQATPPVPTGIAVEIPEGYVGKVVPRSGLAAKNGISIVNSPGIIDCDYRGEIKITLVNHSQHKFPIRRGDRIAQMLIEKVEPVQFEYVTELSETVRGEGGFGSTGVSTEIPVAKTEPLPSSKPVRRAY